MATTVCKTLFLIVVLGVAMALQEEYNEQDQLGYSCSAPGTQCSSQVQVVYRVRVNESFSDVAATFGVKQRQILKLNKLLNPKMLVVGQPILVPVSCSCSSANRSSAALTHVVVAGDTYYLIATQNFGGLTTHQAIDAANPTLNATGLNVGDNVTVPIRCACIEPEANATAVTYPVVTETNAGIICSELGVSEDDVVRMNELEGPYVKLQPKTTLLIPVKIGTSLILKAPEINGTAESPKPTSEGPKLSWGVYLGVGCAVLGLVMVIIAAAILVCCRKRLLQSADTKAPTSYPVFTTTKGSSQLSSSKVPLNTGLIANMSDLMESEKPLWYTLQELKEATDDFDPACLVQGSVYAGVLRGTDVAIKRIRKNGELGRFSGIQKELNILGRVHHANLVSLVGACHEEDQTFLVYEFAQNGALSQWLHSRKNSSATLSWKLRLGVALDVASGLEYLHDYTKPSLVHKDLTSNNILLDAEFRAKIANFRTAMDSSSFTSPSSTKNIIGTQGYMAPEYIGNGTVSSSMDVFAFGVVMLELLTGLPPIFTLQQQRARLTDCSLIRLLESGSEAEQRKRVMEWVDPAMLEQCHEEAAFTFAVLAKSCIQENPDARPTMRNVSYSLAQLNL